MNIIRQKIRYGLKASEKYLKTDMIYLARGSFWSGLNFIVSASLSFGLTLVFANLLSKESYGIYKYIFSIYGLLGAISFSSLDLLIVQAITKNNEGVLKRAFNYSLKWNIPFLIASLGVSIYYYLQNNNSISIAFAVIAILTPLTTSYGVYNSFLNGKKDFRLISLSNAITSIISSLAVFLVIVYTQNPVFIVISYFITHAISSALFYYYTTQKYQPNSNFEEGSLNKGKHFSLMNVFTVISQNIDKIFIFHFLGGSSLAIYSFAIAPVSQIQGLLKLTGPIYNPKVLVKTKEENKKELPKKFIQIALLMIIPIIGYILIAPYFYKTFFPQYSEAIIYSQFYVLILLTFGKKFIGTSSMVHLPKKTLYKLSIINPAIDIISKLILLYFFGLAGIIAGMLISSLLITIIAFYYFKRM